MNHALAQLPRIQRRDLGGRRGRRVRGCAPVFHDLQGFREELANDRRIRRQQLPLQAPRHPIERIDQLRVIPLLALHVVGADMGQQARRDVAERIAQLAKVTVRQQRIARRFADHHRKAIEERMHIAGLQTVDIKGQRIDVVRQLAEQGSQLPAEPVQRARNLLLQQVKLLTALGGLDRLEYRDQVIAVPLCGMEESRDR